MKNVVLSGLVAVALVSVACSSAEPAPVEEEKSEPQAATTKPKDEPKATTEGEPVIDPPKAESDAGTTEDDPRRACLDGCAEKNTEGAKQFSAIAEPCACAPDVCGDVCDACGTAGDGKELLSTASAECRECVVAALKPGGTCNAKVMAECPSQASCVPFALCVQGCAQE